MSHQLWPTCTSACLAVTYASLCVGIWSSLGLVKDGDIKMFLGIDDVIVGEENDLPKV